MRIAMFASLLGVEATGQSMVAANTASRLAKAGHTVTVIATDCGYQGQSVTRYVEMSPEVNVKIFPAKGRLNRRLYRSTALIQWVREHIEEFDVLDVQGIWSYSGMVMARIFHQHDKPYVLTPHGTMTRYDWQKSGLKRKLFFQLGFNTVWKEADAVRFTSSGEGATSYYPARGRAVVIPNGITADEPPSKELRNAARARLGIPMNTAVLLFLGRITHQKGVKETVAAVEAAAHAMPDLYLFLVGPSVGEYGESVMASIAQSVSRDRIVATGPIFGDARNDYFRAADAFITLSHNEGMSIAHLEALSHGLPMILTESSNLDHLEEYAAGIITNHNVQDGSRAILKMMGSSAVREHASLQARRLVEEKFEWNKVIPQLAALYQELIDNRKNS